MIYFPKIGKTTIFHTKSTSSTNITGKKIRKIGFYGKTSSNFKSFSLKLIAQVTIIVEHTENSHLLSQIWHFLKCHNNCYSTSVNCSHAKISKEQLPPHMPIVKRITVSVTNTHLFFFKHIIVSISVTNAQITKTTNNRLFYNCKLNR